MLVREQMRRLSKMLPTPGCRNAGNELVMPRANDIICDAESPNTPRVHTAACRAAEDENRGQVDVRHKLVPNVAGN